MPRKRSIALAPGAGAIDQERTSLPPTTQWYFLETRNIGMFRYQNMPTRQRGLTLLRLTRLQTASPHGKRADNLCG
uniref:Uncharacterized protein n=1 Tax=Acidithiobacillus sulfuriphilus TaxID=1867749 RepID=A0A3M8QZS2_9PROT|nr:hypothetical protein EC580_08775 [Acidithiobacillus sulfuriphilus]